MTNTAIIPKFDEALEIAKRNIRNFVPTLFTGRAGTGKSYLIQELKKEFPRLCLTAPTNIAAKNIRGRTLHRTFHLPNEHYKDNKPIKFKNRRTLVIDEVSMVGVNRYREILEYSGKKSNIILVGDFGQFSPVLDDPLFPILENDQHIEKYELTENFRHKDDPAYLEILNELYEYGQTDRVMQFVNSRTNISLPEKFIYLATLNADVNAYNNHFDKKTIGTLVRGNNNRNRIKNNEMGIVIDNLLNGMLLVRLFTNDDLRSENSKKSDSEQFVEVYPADVEIAEGNTLHRIQGKTLSKVVINRNQIHRFSAGLYVAMSRVRHIDDIYFIDGEIRYSKLFFSSLERGSAGAKTVKKDEQRTERRKKASHHEDEHTESKNCVYIKKYCSNTTSKSMILLNEYYIGKNNGFTVWIRNSLLQKLGMIKRINYHQADEHGFYQKTNYDYKILKPFPYFAYTPDCEKQSLYSKDVSVFESLNPIKPGASPKTHLDEDCYSTTRFLFEIDEDDNGNKLKDLSKRERAKWKAIYKAAAIELGKKGIVNRIVSSGNVSYHCIVETSYEVPVYIDFWDHLNDKYFEGRADRHCAHPSHWTRTPGLIRRDTRKVQRSYLNNTSVFDPTDELKEMERVREQEGKKKIPSVPKNRKEAFALAVETERLKGKKENAKLKMKLEAQQLLDSIFPPDGFIKWAKVAINCLHGFGYSSNEIWKLLKPAGKDKKGRDRRDKVKGYVFKNRPPRNK